jgi:PTS system N-acetylglucosamine-specific IIC component
MTTTTAAGPGRKFVGLGQLQRVGRSLMLPIAALPAAGLLLRLGQPDLLGAIPGFKTGGAVIASAGNALFGALPLLFAVGVAIGFAKKSDGSTALAAVVGYLVFSNVGNAMSPLVLGLPAKGGTQTLVDYSVLGGILMGITAALLWQKFHRISLPSYLAFFGGRRFVPIITAGVALVLGVLLSFVYPAFAGALTDFGNFVTSNNIWGGFMYGMSNRLLIPVGLHHILNSVLWFVVGDYHGVHGDIARFFAGDPTAGSFMTGFFPIMMFALPAGALAIWAEAKQSQKKIVGGIMLSGALTSMLTGVTEPLEFSFMFVAWPLYLIHAFLTGTSLALVNFLGIRDGFSFSAGTIDYVLNFGLAHNPLWLIPIGLMYAVIYYFVFRWVIRKWNLKTPGRGDDEILDAAGADSTSSMTA